MIFNYSTNIPQIFFLLQNTTNLHDLNKPQSYPPPLIQGVQALSSKLKLTFILISHNFL